MHISCSYDMSYVMSYCVFVSAIFSVVAFLWRMYGRTDTMCENNDHVIGPGLVGKIYTMKWALKLRLIHELLGPKFLNIEVMQKTPFDPLGQPKVTAERDHCFRTCCPSVRLSPLFKSRETKQQKTLFATGVTMGLAEWIIDDTCLVQIRMFSNKVACL